VRAASFFRGRLSIEDVAVPVCADGQVMVAVEACGVCRTDLHILDGELPPPSRPIVLGHQIVGRVVESRATSGPSIGVRVGVPWLGWTCGVCDRCRAGEENLCERAEFTGYTLDGGFAERVVADARYCFPLPEGEATSLAPLLCAGLIGHRAYRIAGTAPRLGLYGFGAAAHILTQVAVYEGRRVYAFVRPGDERTKQFALRLGAVWAGDSTDSPPEPLDAAILFAADGALVPLALRAVRPGGTVVCAGIHMSDIPSFPYADLWMERTIRSVANLTRADGAHFFPLAAAARVATEVTVYELHDVERALQALRSGAHEGSIVIRVS
jgi:propanol-preferring alcohol dehydrogenase